MGYVTKKGASKILGVSLRQITNYLASGELVEDHRANGKVMININNVFDLRKVKRKGGKSCELSRAGN